MFKITRTSGESRPHRLVIEGRLLKPWIDELLIVCHATAERSSDIELDLANVTFVDEVGAAVLVGLMRRGAVVVGKSPFISEMLKEESAL